MQNTIIHGDCLQILPTVAAGSANLILTDPPYITRYKGRDGRIVPNDDNDRWLMPAFAEMRGEHPPDYERSGVRVRSP
jgi:DNA modification methylase